MGDGKFRPGLNTPATIFVHAIKLAAKVEVDGIFEFVVIIRRQITWMGDLGVRDRYCDRTTLLVAGGRQ